MFIVSDVFWIVWGSVGVIMYGALLFLKPALAIEMQRRFYARINWRLEPISMERELKTTKVMGLVLILVNIIIVTYYSFSQ